MCWDTCHPWLRAHWATPVPGAQRRGQEGLSRLHTFAYADLTPNASLGITGRNPLNGRSPMRWGLGLSIPTCLLDLGPSPITRVSLQICTWPALLESILAASGDEKVGVHVHAGTRARDSVYSVGHSLVSPPSAAQGNHRGERGWMSPSGRRARGRNRLLRTRQPPATAGGWWLA